MKRFHDYMNGSVFQTPAAPPYPLLFKYTPRLWFDVSLPQPRPWLNVYLHVGCNASSNNKIEDRCLMSRDTQSRKLQFTSEIDYRTKTELVV